MEREHVDRSALAPDRERDLDLDRPIEFGQPPNDCLDDGGVSLIDEPIEPLPSPAQPEIDVRARLRADRDRSPRSGSATDRRRRTRPTASCGAEFGAPGTAARSEAR